ncbi:hypothetical protein BH10ACT1_BH10ACT1_36870 [soil metagenome]
MTPDRTSEPLEARLARAGDELDRLAARADLATRAPTALGPRRPKHLLVLATAAVLVVAAAAAVVLTRGDGFDRGVSTVPGPDASTSAPAPDGRDLLSFRPVLSVVPNIGGACDASPGYGSDLVPSEDRSECYSLSTQGFDGNAVASAEAAREQGWTVRITIRPDRRALVNEVFDRCYDGIPNACPAAAHMEGHGIIAVVWRGRVVSAPIVNAPGLADESFAITKRPAFDEAEARAFADEID